MKKKKYRVSNIDSGGEICWNMLKKDAGCERNCAHIRKTREKWEYFFGKYQNREY